MPGKTRMGFDEDAAWEFDDGSVTVKSFTLESQVGDPESPGTRALTARLSNGEAPAAETLVDGCLEAAGPLEASAETREALLAGAGSGEHSERVARLLMLVVATPEYQFA